MNKHATASVSAICKALPFERRHTDGNGQNDLLLLVVFGSQVRGTETPQSDLDILYMTRGERWALDEAIRQTALGASGGVGAVSVFAHTPQSVRKFANLYGTMEYEVLRGIGGVKTLYRSESVDDMLGSILREPDLVQCASRWLQLAEEIIFHSTSPLSQKKISRLVGLTCFDMYKAIGNILRACLMSAGVRFPFTRDLSLLYDMLPTAEMRASLSFLDFDALEHWKAYCSTKNVGSADDQYTDDDVSAATAMAKRSHIVVKNIVKCQPQAVPLADVRAMRF